MKIAILTQPLRTNFGGILQNYALQAILRKLGHEPITIDYDCRYTKLRWLMGRAKSILTGSAHHIQYPRYNRSGQENLNAFIHRYITMTKPVNTPAEGWEWLRKVWMVKRVKKVKKVLKVKNVWPDAVIVGSDQVWSPWANVPLDFLGNMYLDFIPDYKGKRIAYAASFGGGEWTYTPEWTEKCSRLAKRFDAISVREDSGVKLCKEHLGVDATHVLDPTLLLTGADYEQLLSSPSSLSSHSKPYLFAYVLDTSDEKVSFLCKVADKFGLELKIQGANDDLSWDDSIEGWVSDIRNAAMVVTDSFHGSVFAIQFHTPFLSIPNNRRGVDRFTSILNKLGLTNRMVSAETEIDSITNDIDWGSVEEILAEERELSIQFLKNNL